MVMVVDERERPSPHTCSIRTQASIGGPLWIHVGYQVIDTCNNIAAGNGAGHVIKYNDDEIR
jgi:hypothetical protein